MIETKFKTLFYLGNFVEYNLLEKGIYSCSKPHIFDMSETIESLEDKAEFVKDKMGKHFVSDSYFENLKKCELREIEIKIKP